MPLHSADTTGYFHSTSTLSLDGTCLGCFRKIHLGVSGRYTEKKRYYIQPGVLRLMVRTNIKKETGGTWVAPSVKELTLDFSSGHDLRVMERSLYLALHSVGSLLRFFPSPFAPRPRHVHSHVLSLPNK